MNSEERRGEMVSECWGGIGPSLSWMALKIIFEILKCSDVKE
jgi:hypothetical protein